MSDLAEPLLRSDDVPPSDSGNLTLFIETRYHARHRADLPRLAQLAEKVESVHFGSPGVPEGLADILAGLIGELEVHMKKEELMLFPAIRRGGGDLAMMTAVMRADHGDHEAAVAAIRRLTHDFTPPTDACGSWRSLYAGLAQFIADLDAHMHLENDVLFPRFEPAPVPKATGGCGCGCGGH